MVWIPRIHENEKGLGFLGVSRFESQTTGPQTTQLSISWANLLVDNRRCFFQILSHIPSTPEYTEPLRFEKDLYTNIYAENTRKYTYNMLHIYITKCMHNLLYIYIYMCVCVCVPFGIGRVHRVGRGVLQSLEDLGWVVFNMGQGKKATIITNTKKTHYESLISCSRD